MSSNPEGQFPFRFGRAFDGAKKLQMLAPDIGNHSMRRFCNITQICYLARMVGSDFDHDNLVFFLEAEQRLRNTDMIVQIPLRAKDIVLCG